MLIVHDQIGVIDAKLFGIPVLDQPVEHVEIMREVDDPGRVAMGETDLDRAGESAFGRREFDFLHILSA